MVPEMEPNSSPLSSPPSTPPETFQLVASELPPQLNPQNSQSSQPDEVSGPIGPETVPQAADPTISPEMATKHVSKRSTVQDKRGKDNNKPKGTAVRRNAAPPIPTSSANRPTRNRRAPDRFWEVEENVVPEALPITKGTSKTFDPTYITTNSTSRLAKADVYHLLLEDSAWESLSTEQQSTLISMLPQDSANLALLEKVKAGVTDDTRPQAFTVSNDCFRTDVAKFKDDLKNGHLAKTWQTSAEQAVLERAAGEYDDWKTEEAERWWGQKSK